MTNLTDYKERKRVEQILSDLAQAQRLLGLSQHALKPFKKYVPIDAVLSVIHDNQTLVNLYIQKCKVILLGLKDD